MIIEFHYTYIILLFSFVITGYFPNIIILTSIIIIHELGHYIIAKLLKLKPYRIIIYPYGGLTKMSNLVNTPINKEIIVSISGLFFQILYFLLICLLYKHNLIRPYIFSIYKTYHLSIFIFNILPIHPLDGSIFLNLLLSKFIPFRLSMYLNIIISLVTGAILIIINYNTFNYTTILIAGIIINYLYKYKKDLPYLYNRLLLERYLFHLKYKCTVIIKNQNQFYKEKNHLIMNNYTYIGEFEFLNTYFKGKNIKNV